MKPAISRTSVDTPLSASRWYRKSTAGNRPSPDLGDKRGLARRTYVSFGSFSVAFLSMLFGASFYQFVADVPNWNGLPALEHYRASIR